MYPRCPFDVPQMYPFVIGHAEKAMIYKGCSGPLDERWIALNWLSNHVLVYVIQAAGTPIPGYSGITIPIQIPIPNGGWVLFRHRRPPLGSFCSVAC